ncbi:hypothetical protein SOASR032_23880 [Pragia fontium]|uniref:tRNA_anti-like n=1 Tax=Pragia fontium TaxID=82985 RepID=A0ABQ5LJS4_9GAMM|nr:hypothetical protein [Pragia fontium]AKJ42848.1 hypothetical protein QQ39_12845 [Pragia fontium]GKX63819.1 hypothetical protein SOASR032_23880 [Pragia fontium]
MKKVLKWIAIIFVALIVIGALVGKDEDNASNSEGKANSVVANTTTTTTSSAPETPKPAPKKEVYSTTAKALFNDYDANEVALDEKLKGKIIEVKGIVQSIDKDFLDNIVIELRTSNEFMPAQMTMDDNQKSVASSLKKGQTVIITCKKMTRIMGSPSGDDCVFNK